MLAEECRETWTSVAWDSTVPSFSSSVLLTTEDLASLLSDQWVNDDMVNAGLDLISRRLSDNSRTRVVHCLFIASLQRVHSRGTYAPRRQTPVDIAIQADDVDELVFTLFIHNSHWTVLVISLPTYTYTYCDSKNAAAKPPNETIKLLEWWLGHLRSDLVAKSLVVSPSPSWHAPRQADCNSCGIVCLSLIAAKLLDYEPWTQSTSAQHQMEWYLRLSEALQDASERKHDKTSSTSTPKPPCTPTSATKARAAAALAQAVADSSEADQRQIKQVRRTTGGTSSHASDSADSSLQASRQGRAESKRGTKTSSSWLKQKALRNRVHDGTFKINNSKLQSFRDKVRVDDTHAEFKANDILAVRCSACAEWLTMRVPYDIKNWKTHRATKKCSRNAASGRSNISLQKMFASNARPAKPKPIQKLPCPGLTRESNKKVARYLRRTSTPGGGAPSRMKIAQDLFRLKKKKARWASLSDRRRQMVLRHEQTLYRWVNRRDVGAVFATDCHVFVAVLGDDKEPPPCLACLGLYGVHTYQVQLNRPLPDEDKMKFVPIIYRCQDLGELYLKYKGLRQLVETDDGRLPWLRFSQGVVAGHYRDYDVLLGCVEAIVTKVTRIQRGKSLRGMVYPRIFTDFVNHLAMISPCGYKVFQHHFGGPAFRSIRRWRTKLSGFLPGFVASNIDTAASVLQQLDYHGPVALAWDDTLMEAALSIWQESKDSTCLILGAASGIIEVSESDDLDEVFERAKLDRADKLRLYVLTIPLHKVPPIIIAAITRGSRDDAESLTKMHLEVVQLLNNAKIYPVSFASDGSDVERSLQRNILNTAERYIPYVIEHSTGIPACRVELQLHLFADNHPATTSQDPEHARKTTRNQCLTGSHILAAGNHPLYFAQVRDFAIQPHTPLFRRNVEKVDKQDDRAAARFFSAEALSQHLQLFPERVALSTYMFVLGEGIDAWLNRNMVLRMRFFLMVWRSFIDHHPEYSPHIQFISHESYDIFLTLCNSLLSLILIYRLWYPSYPLLPWLHSTSPVEHTFGVLRTLKKDFTYIDMIHLEPKLRILILGDFANISPEEQANRTAGGYAHTYYSADDLDLKNLLMWPTDSELRGASNAAYEEASQLLAVLGIDAARMLRDYQAPSASRAQSASGPREPQTLAQLLALYDHTSFQSQADESEFDKCVAALVTESTDRSLAISNLPDAQETKILAIKDSIASQVTSQSTPAAKSGVSVPGETLVSMTPEPCRIRNADLVAQRTRHQTAFTAKAIHSIEEPNGARPPNLRDELLRRLKTLGPSIENSLPSTTAGADRHVRHTGQFKFGLLRQQAFLPLQDIHETIATANINLLCPLASGDFVMARHPRADAAQEILIGRVMTLYAKSDGRGAKHDWTASAHSIGAVSYVMVQVYTVLQGSLYTSITQPQIQATTFLRIPRTHLIMSLSSFSGDITVQALQFGDASPMEFVALGARVSQLLRTLTNRKSDVCRAVKTLCQLLNPRRKPVAPASAAASAANPTEVLQMVGDGFEESSDSDESAS
ncbi:uncharacterized protein B0H18DRAFT_1082220 [Fomitopsis serialis]|uniref:uncharacterized protein n=1 Tax=Fomitopsis serialis TaxID=139415 RepID=UPI002008763D|nr:uncharacterized protein B0H18DRAFT_1082220 [Neoantrodia serialis]KAH9935430.1 hypothetical protein B0H18DRAFT_1082220 [Neoantrodia serialis]